MKHHENAVKTAWKLLTDRIGGVDATAAACNTQRSMVSQYGDRNGDRFPPAQIIMRAEHYAGEPLVTAALARANGWELTRIEPAGDAVLLAGISAELSKDIGELFATLSHALTHQKLDPQERTDLIRELGAVQRVAAQGLALLVAQDNAHE